MKPFALCAAAVAVALTLSAAVMAAPDHAPTAGRSDAAPAQVAAARHQGFVNGGAVRWISEYELAADRPAVIELAYPLPEGTKLEPGGDVTSVERAGRVVALRLVPDSAPFGRVSVTLVVPLGCRWGGSGWAPRSVPSASSGNAAQPLAPPNPPDCRGGEARISPPLASGNAVQIVDLGGPDDLRFEPLPRTQLERHVGFFAPVDLPPSARDAADRAVGYHRTRTNDDPMYVVVTAPIAADQGIRGSFSTASERLRAGALGASAVFAALVAGLVLLQRRLARAARVEQAERALAEEFARLDEG